MISELLFTSVVESEILPRYKTDHSLVLLKLEFGKFQKERSYWKFNNSLFKDNSYVTEVKKNVIETIKLQYTKESQNYSNITEIPLEYNL